MNKNLRGTTRNKNSTARNRIMTRKNNKEKIMDTLKSIRKPITTTGLAKESNIDIKNITRYLKALESEHLIKRDTIQKGKIRLVMISLSARKTEDKIDITPKKPIFIKDIEKDKPVIIKPIPVRPKEPVIPKEALTEKEIKALIRDVLKEEQKIEIDANRLYRKVRSLDAEAEENAYYKVIIERTQTKRRSWLNLYVSFINEYFDEVKKR